MRTNIDKALKGVDALQGRALRGAETGLQGQTGAIVSDLRATGAHGDVTGATRAAYTAGVVGPTLDTLTGAVQSSAATVDSFNPGHSKVESVGNVGAEIALIATVASDYQEYLSGNVGGAHDALGPTMLQNAGRLAEAAAAGIRRELGG